MIGHGKVAEQGVRKHRPLISKVNLEAEPEFNFVIEKLIVWNLRIDWCLFGIFPRQDNKHGRVKVRSLASGGAK